MHPIADPLHYKQYSMEALTLLAMARVPVGAVSSINQYSYAKLVMGALGMAGRNVNVVVQWQYAGRESSAVSHSLLGIGHLTSS